MGELEVRLRGKSLADYTNTQLRMALGAVLYTNTADMWDKYLKSLGYSGSVSAMLEKYYVDYAIPSQFRNYINVGAAINNPQNLFVDGSKGYIYDNNDYVNPASWRRNLLTYSDQFDNAAWVKNASVTLTPNTTIAPDGTQTADTLAVVDSTSQISQTVTGAGSGTYTFSMWIKLLSATIGTTVRLLAVVDGGTAIVTVTPTTEWVRYSLQMTANTSVTSIQAIRGLALNGTIAIWGAQLEVGPTPTEYQRITDFNSDFLAAYPNTTLFVDSAGTQPALVNGLVGLQLDKSGGLALGAELLGTGTTLLIGTATASSYNTTTGEGSVSRAADFNNQSVVQFASLNASAFYKIVISNTGATSLNVHSSGGAVLITTITAGNSATLYSLAVGGNFQVRATSNSTTATFTVSSIREYAGNHRYQTTTGSKPILRGTPVGSTIIANGDFATDTVWNKGSGWSIGGGVATKVAGTTNSLLQSVSVTAGKIYRFTYTVTATAGGVQPLFSGGTSAFGILRSASGTYVEYITANTGNVDAGFTVNATFAGTVDNVEIVDVSAGTVTAPYGLQYDGIDDFLTTASVDFTATDKMAVVMGVRKLSDAARGVLVELSASSVNAGSFTIDAPAAAGNYRAGANLTTGGEVTATTFTAPVTNVFSVRYDPTVAGVTNQIAIRVNGVTPTVAGAGSTSAANFGNYALFFGRRGGTIFPMNGLDFGGVCIGKTLTATQLANVEKWVSLRTGVTI